MLIREAGIIRQGLPIIFATYHRASKEKIDLYCTSGCMSGLLTFADCLMTPIEYFESSKYSIIFKTENIEDNEGRIEEITAFIILDKDYRLEKYLHKTILPLLEKLLNKFISRYNGSNFTKSKQFDSFRNTIDKLFSTGTQTLEEKVISLLSLD